jgi:lipoprotein Spr
MTSCSLLKPVAQKADKVDDGPFMKQVSIMVESSAPVTQTSSVIQANNFDVIDKKDRVSFTRIEDIEQFMPSAFRYSLLLDIEVEAIKNQRLFEYISRWWATPYRIGGNGFDGIDCSGFVSGITLETFQKKLPRTSKEQADFCMPINKEEIQEGDLVFFHTRRGVVSHVGMYLANNKFVHASTSVGVTISDLNETYWKNRLVKIGRIPAP